MHAAVTLLSPGRSKRAMIIMNTVDRVHLLTRLAFRSRNSFRLPSVTLTPDTLQTSFSLHALCML